MIWVATADGGRPALGPELELEAGAATVALELGEDAVELWLGPGGIEPDDDELADDWLDDLMAELGVSEIEVRPALRPRPDPNEAALIALVASLAAANVTLWASTVAVAAALLALP